MTDLEKRIADSSQLYYSNGSSDISDSDWDNLIEQLKKESPDSPLLKKIGCGYDVLKDTTPGEKYNHKYGKIGSLEKCRTYNEIYDDFHNKSVDISAKLDGLSVVLYYKSGKFIQALTRGNGIIGIDITDKIKIIMNTEINDMTFTGAVRGEIIFRNSQFERYRLKYPECKNPRNSAAGLINAKEYTDDLKYLDVVVYSVVGLEHTSMIAMPISYIRKWLSKNFEHTAPHIMVNISEDAVSDIFEDLKDCWSIYYPIDGLVLTGGVIHINSNTHEVLYTAQAFKFKSETAQSKILNIEWNMSKTGYAVPRIQIEPVQLAGTTVQYCTGYNAQYISENKVSAGSIVEIEKRGEIIPNINKVIATNGDAKLPEYCPYCNCELQWNGVHLSCNNSNCSNTITQDTMIWTNILAPVDGLGERLKELFLTEIYGIVPSVEELMQPKLNVFRTAPKGTQTYKMKLMFDSLFSNDKIKLSDAIKALNIPRFGDINANKLAQHPEYLKQLMELACDGSCADGLKIYALLNHYKSNIGIANTESLENNMNKLTRLKFISHRIDWFTEEIPAEYKGKIAITGKLSVKRSEFEKELKDAGYVPSEISKDTKFLVTDNPDSSSSKNKKADAWGIPKITEQEFRTKYMN